MAKPSSELMKTYRHANFGVSMTVRAPETQYEKEMEAVFIDAARVGRAAANERRRRMDQWAWNVLNDGDALDEAFVAFSADYSRRLEELAAKSIEVCSQYGNSTIRNK